MTLASGSRLGTYEILDSLGAGGMGEVYRARDTNLHRDVAIKILPDASVDDEKRLARFEREARLLAALNHPSIATIHGLEYSGPRRYIVMELVPGETLADRLATGPLPVDEAIRIGRQIAEGLEAAHARGVIHCDLKPPNIALTPDGRVKLLDFGLARAFALDSSSDDLSFSPTITSELAAPGVVSGTVPYMSPEQARGRDIDKRTDIWAFGCVLYEMLTGRRAFTGATIAETLAAIFETDPDWGPLPAKTPANVRELLRHCTQKDPSRRLRDIGDARIELDDTFSGQTRQFPEPRPRRPRVSRRGMIALAAAAVAVALGVYWSLRPRPDGARPATRQLAVLPFRNLTGTAEGELMGLAMAETVSVRLANVSDLQVVTPRAAIEATDRDSNFARVARRLGVNTLLSGTLQRENKRFRITYRLVDAGGNQLAANSFDGSELFALQDLVADGVVRDLRLRRGKRRTPTPSGLDTVSEQERYLQAIGLLQRSDKSDSVEQAIRILTALAAERPNSPLVHAALGRGHLFRFNDTRDPKWVDLAMTSCARAEQLAPGLPEVDVTRGELFLGTGRPREAAAAFERALSVQPTNVQALIGLANAHEASGRAAPAEATYLRAIALQPSYWEGYSRLAAFYYGQGRYAKAVEFFRRVTHLTPDNANAFSNLGATYSMMGRFEEALRTYQASLALAPTDAAYSNMGTTLFYLGRYRESADAFEKAVQRTPGHFLFWANLGDAYRWAKGLESKAPEAYRQAIALARQEISVNPRNGQAHSYLGTCLAKTGQAQMAEEQARQALSLEAGNPEFLYGAATVSCLAGRKAEALERLRRAVEAGFPRAIAERDPELAALKAEKSFEQITGAGS